MNNELTPKEARVLLMTLDNEDVYKILKHEVAILYGELNEKVTKWPRTIKRKIKKLYMSQFCSKPMDDANDESTRVALAYRRNSSHSTLYTPGTEQLKEFEKEHGFAMTVGCINREYPKTKREAGKFWMVHFHHAVARDGADAISLHKTLMQIREFRDLCAFDVPFFDLYNYE